MQRLRKKAYGESNSPLSATQKPRQQFLGSKKGSAYYELIIKTLVFITLIATTISFLSIFTVYINLNFTCRRVVRAIELDGQVTSNTNALFEQLKAQTNIGTGATMEAVNVTYFDAMTKKIQLRNTFSVRLKTNYVFNIVTPSFAPAVAINIPMETTLTGMSEKFWK